MVWFKGLKKRYERIYAWAGVAVLGLSSLGWAIAGARLAGGNSDQLVSGFLFQNWRTLHGATFPASHTQLIKWPLFAALRFFDLSAGAYQAFTVAVCLGTVGALAYGLYRINEKPLVFGTLCLALASVLVLIPAQIYSGVQAPLNMAMLSSRNLEYIVYVGVLSLIIKSARLKSRLFLLVALVLSLLAASDHLFIFMSLGGSLALFIFTYLANNPMLLVARRWLLASIAAWPAAALIQAVTGHFVVHIFNDSPGYGLSDNWHNLQPAFSGTGRALGLNFGISGQAGALAIVPMVFNVLVVASVWVAGYQLVKKSGRQTKRLSGAAMLSAMLLATSLVTIVSYIGLNQPHIGNARYLMIVLFSGFVILANYSRQVSLSASKLIIVGAVAAITTGLGLLGIWRHTDHILATSRLSSRNQAVAKALQNHPEQYLVGNYWRVFPVRLISPHASQAVVPLAGCFNPTRLLGSSAWQPDLRTHSFAYILPLQSLGYSSADCQERQISRLYGPPSSAAIIAGSRSHPQELLLFYDNGSIDR